MLSEVEDEEGDDLVTEDGVDGVGEEEESATSGGYNSFMICVAVGSCRLGLASGERMEEEEVWRGRFRMV